MCSTIYATGLLLLYIAHVLIYWLCALFMLNRRLASTILGTSPWRLAYCYLFINTISRTHDWMKIGLSAVGNGVLKSRTMTNCILVSRRCIMSSQYISTLGYSILESRYELNVLSE